MVIRSKTAPRSKAAPGFFETHSATGLTPSIVGSSTGFCGPREPCFTFPQNPRFPSISYPTLMNGVKTILRLIDPVNLPAQHEMPDTPGEAREEEG